MENYPELKANQKLTERTGRTDEYGEQDFLCSPEL